MTELNVVVICASVWGCGNAQLSLVRFEDASWTLGDVIQRVEIRHIDAFQNYLK